MLTETGGSHAEAFFPFDRFAKLRQYHEGEKEKTDLIKWAKMTDSQRFLTDVGISFDLRSDEGE
ncbi:MAG: hypothetical protein IKN86_10140 [Bacteroidaceae bacterium]|nr:hypothetical protein [Bacteroidaceae bacterium]